MAKSTLARSIFLLIYQYFNSLDIMVEIECIDERERFAQACVCEVDRSGRGKRYSMGCCSIWLLFIEGTLTTLRYVDIILESQSIPLIKTRRGHTKY